MTKNGGYAAIGLHNPRDRRNVGAVLRAAYCFEAALVAVSGRRYKVQRTDTASTHVHLPLLQIDDLRLAVPYDCVPVAVERRADALPLPTYQHPRNAFYVFGPEDGDLGKSVLSWCRDVVYIPTAHSLNLAAAVNIVLYDRTAKRSAQESPTNPPLAAQ
jgi:tRNA(Leu) C34 or U34 (ribose-2'-O)-methylase TrmL